VRRLVAVGLPPGDHAVFGSGPLLVRGWIDHAGDLDVLARGAAWEHALRVGHVRRLEPEGVDVVDVAEDVTVGTEWAIGAFSTDALIDEAEVIDGVPCVRLEHVIAYKRIADRPKDRLHLAVIAERLERGER
jgi:hypothetical protein